MNGENLDAEKIDIFEKKVSKIKLFISYMTTIYLYKISINKSMII